MGHGIQVFNPDGSLQFDAGNRLPRIVAVTNTGTTSGSVSVPAISQGTPIAIAAPAVSDGGASPAVSISGSTVSWNWSGISGAEDNVLSVMVY
jgi:hypothetical protein